MATCAGVKALFNDTLKGRIDRFVSVDGSGHGITNIAVGSRRYRVTFRAPAATATTISAALTRRTRSAGRWRVWPTCRCRREPRTTFSVGRVGGGTSVNAIPAEAWMEVDMRSADPAALQALDAGFRQAVDRRAGAGERALERRRAADRRESSWSGDRPAGRTDESSPIVETAWR